MVREEKSQGMAPPMSIPMRTIGIETRIPVLSKCMASGMLSCAWTLVTSVMKEPKSETAAMTADPIATPLVIAFVVLPTASRSAMIWRAFLSKPAISPMP